MKLFHSFLENPVITVPLNLPYSQFSQLELSITVVKGTLSVMLMFIFHFCFLCPELMETPVYLICLTCRLFIVTTLPLYLYKACGMLGMLCKC